MNSNTEIMSTKNKKAQVPDSWEELDINEEPCKKEFDETEKNVQYKQEKDISVILNSLPPTERAKAWTRTKINFRKATNINKK